MAFKLRSPAFGPEGELPLKHTRDGADASPLSRWKRLTTLEAFVGTDLGWAQATCRFRG
jgi:hypothetical protein